jgi:hypothetical protein
VSPNEIQERQRQLGQELAHIAEESGGYVAASVKVLNRHSPLYNQSINLLILPAGSGDRRRFELVVRPTRQTRSPGLGSHSVVGPMLAYSLASSALELGHDFEEFYGDFIKEHE